MQLGGASVGSERGVGGGGTMRIVVVMAERRSALSRGPGPHAGHHTHHAYTLHSSLDIKQNVFLEEQFY